MLLHIRVSPPRQRLCEKKDTRCTVADILVILVTNAIPFGTETFTEICKELDLFFIHTNDRVRLVIRTAIYLKHVLHCGHKCGVLLWRDAPTFLQVRLKFFF